MNVTHGALTTKAVEVMLWKVIDASSRMCPARIIYSQVNKRLHTYHKVIFAIKIKNNVLDSFCKLPIV